MGYMPPSPRDFDVTAKMAAVTSLMCDYGGSRGLKMAVEVKMVVFRWIWKLLISDLKLKALW